jgi:hypothetical protein
MSDFAVRGSNGDHSSDDLQRVSGSPGSDAPAWTLGADGEQAAAGRCSDGLTSVAGPQLGTLGAAIWPLHDLQGYMGQADIQTTMIYVHHVPKVTAAEELSRAVASAIGAGASPLAAGMTERTAELF